MHLIEQFSDPTLPARYTLGAGLEIYPDEKTDFWQRTHYGFRNDNGHCLLLRLSGDFRLSALVEFKPHTRYDQCGLMVRGDAENWIKVSTEYEDEHTSRLGSVVTNLGYSDWATQDIDSTLRAMAYRISRNGNDFLLENSYDGQRWQQMRIAHLHRVFEQLDIGVYACSPIGKDHWCRFKWLEIAENEWSYTGE
jgi:uncharacterized protein